LNADGTFSVTFTVPAFVEGAAYALYSSKAHGQGTSDPSQNAAGAIAYAAPVAQTTVTSWSSVPPAPVVEGTAVTLEATVDPAAAGTVTFLEGSTVLGSGSVDTATGKASASISGLAVGSHSIIASYAPVDTAAYLPSLTAEAATVTVDAQTPVGPTQTALVLTGSASSVSDGTRSV